MILHINTKDQKTIKVSLKKAGNVVHGMSEENQFGSQVLLPFIVKLLRTYKPFNRRLAPCLELNLQTRFAKLKGIEVETGPGSFTGLRVGVSVSNALGFSLGITVNGKGLETKLQY